MMLFHMTFVANMNSSDFQRLRVEREEIVVGEVIKACDSHEAPNLKWEIESQHDPLEE